MKILWMVIINLCGLLFLLINTYLFTKNKQVRNSVSKIFILYLVMLSIIEISCNIIGTLNPNSNFFLSHLYFGFQFVLLSILYYNLILNKIFKKNIIVITIIQSIYLIGFYIINKEAFWNFNTYEIISTSFILIFYAQYFLFQNIEKTHKYFNFSIGLTIYLSCSIAIFLSGSLDLVLCEEPYIDIWVFNSIFYIVFQYFIYKEYLFVKNRTKINNE